MPVTTDNIFEWLNAMRGKRLVKILTGIRGVGKSATLARWRDQLISAGYPEDRIICIDAEEPVLRRMVTADRILDFISTQLPSEGPAIVLIDEPASFPDYEKCIEVLLGNRNLDIYFTLSSRRLLSGGLSDYLRGAIAVRELMPPPDGITMSHLQARARWNELLLRDVLPSPGIADVSIAEGIAAYLSDTVGDPISLRSIAASASPSGHVFSPNTANAYLTALEDAHVIERCYRWDSDCEEVLGRSYRVFFTDVNLRQARFGFAEDDDRRTALNKRWLELRREHRHVYINAQDESSDYDKIKFVTVPSA